jgi:hypothetical protein
MTLDQIALRGALSTGVDMVLLQQEIKNLEAVLNSEKLWTKEELIFYAKKANSIWKMDT